MFLKADHFSGLFEKIAQSITELTASTSSRSRSSETLGNKNLSSRDFNYGSRDNRDKLNLQSTISKARDKADLQPLHKDTGIIYKPADQPFGSRMRNKQEYLGHIEDKRITHHHNRNR